VGSRGFYRLVTASCLCDPGFSNNAPPGLHFLLPLNPRSEEFLELLRSFLSSRDMRTDILVLSEGDARVFIEIIDRVCFPRTFFGDCSSIFSLAVKAFRAARLEPELRQLAFGVLRRLCGKTGHLPESYLLSHKFDLSGLPHASGGFADVRMGVFKGRDVAVKTLRVTDVEDKARIRKVRKTTCTFSSRLAHTPYSASVKKLSCGKTCPIPTSSIL